MKKILAACALLLSMIPAAAAGAVLSARSRLSLVHPPQPALLRPAAGAVLSTAVGAPLSRCGRYPFCSCHIS